MDRKNRQKGRRGISNQGFTLVELMVVLVIASVLMGAIYSAYIVQQKTYLAQEQVAQMQQNIRAGLQIMAQEIRMAGFDPTTNANAGITAATANNFAFTMDLNEDGNFTDPATGGNDTGEVLAYSLYVAADGLQKIGRIAGGIPPPLPPPQAVAESIEAMEFWYTLVDGRQTNAPAALVPAAALSDIQAVQVSILARAEDIDPDYTDPKTYTAGSGAIWGPYFDNRRRRLLITTITCRNLGLGI